MADAAPWYRTERLLVRPWTLADADLDRIYDRYSLEAFRLDVPR